MEGGEESDIELNGEDNNALFKTFNVIKHPCPYNEV